MRWLSLLENLLEHQDINYRKFNSFEEASTNILEMMSKFIQINTLFIAKNDKCTNRIEKVFNRDYLLLEENSSLPFEETYCKLAVDHGRKPLIISDINENELTKKLNVTSNLGSGSFIGIPIYYENGENYGTICGLDTVPFYFTKDHIQMFETMASLLSYLLELDKAHHEIQQLSAPLIPIVDGIAVLPIIGNLNFNRVETIRNIVLHQSQSLTLNHLVIDLLGSVTFDNTVAEFLLSIVKALNLMGISVILTGIKPELAIKIMESNIPLNDIPTYLNLKQALSSIGIILDQKIIEPSV